MAAQRGEEERQQRYIEWFEIGGDLEMLKNAMFLLVVELPGELKARMEASIVNVEEVIENISTGILREEDLEPICVEFEVMYKEYIEILEQVNYI